LPSFTAEPGAAHQIATLDFNGDLPGDVAFAFEGGRRVSDGKWTAAYDPLGRLIRLTRAAAVTGEPRRYEYEYNAANRLSAAAPAATPTTSRASRTSNGSRECSQRLALPSWATSRG
jgi:hypothetical protein